MDAALRMVPTAAALSAALGLLRLTRLKTLVNSPRTCSTIRSPNFKLRKMPISTFFDPGPVMRLRAAVPSVPLAPFTKAATLNQALDTSLRCLLYTSDAADDLL